jgi:hypothetical protein
MSPPFQWYLHIILKSPVIRRVCFFRESHMKRSETKHGLHFSLTSALVFRCWCAYASFFETHFWKYFKMFKYHKDSLNCYFSWNLAWAPKMWGCAYKCYFLLLKNWFFFVNGGIYTRDLESISFLLFIFLQIKICILMMWDSWKDSEILLLHDLFHFKYSRFAQSKSHNWYAIYIISYMIQDPDIDTK